jgi:hypothetical protein
MKTSRKMKLEMMMMAIEKDWLEKVAIAANVYVKQKGVDEDQIDGFITFLFKVYGYSELLNKRKQHD